MANFEPLILKPRAKRCLLRVVSGHCSSMSLEITSYHARLVEKHPFSASHISGQPVIGTIR